MADLPGDRQTEREKAFEEGRAAQRVEMRLGDHDGQLVAMRESVRGLNAAVEAMRISNEAQAERMRQSYEQLSERIDALATEERIRNETNEGIRKALQEANERQITTRQFAFGVIGIILTIVGLVLSQAHIFGNGAILLGRMVVGL